MTEKKAEELTNLISKLITEYILDMQDKDGYDSYAGMGPWNAEQDLITFLMGM